MYIFSTNAHATLTLSINFGAEKWRLVREIEAFFHLQGPLAQNVVTCSKEGKYF